MTEKKPTSGPKISLKALQWRVGELRKGVRQELEESIREAANESYLNSLRGYLKALDDVLKLARKIPREDNK